MIKVITCMAAFVSVLMTGVQAQDYRLRDETTERRVLRFSGTGDRSIAVRNLNGSIRVTGSRGSDVQLDVRRVVRADSQDDIRRGQGESVLDTADQRPNLDVIVRDPDSQPCGLQQSDGRTRRERNRNPPYQLSYDLTLSVPDDTRLVLCTINGSEIEVSDTRGDFDVDNVNGRIRLRDVRGQGNATTVNGPIEATLLAVPTRDAKFETVNGDVEVTWPGDLAANLSLKTMNGGLFTDFEATILASVPRAIRRRDGRFAYRSGDTVNVRVGRGGPQVQLESLNGDVRVLRGSR